MILSNLLLTYHFKSVYKLGDTSVIVFLDGGLDMLLSRLRNTCYCIGIMVLSRRLVRPLAGYASSTQIDICANRDKIYWLRA